MLTEKEALSEVLDFLWEAHAKRNPRHPEQQKMLSSKHQALSSLKVPFLIIT